MIELPSFPPLTPEGEREADRATRFLELLPQFKGRRWAGRPLRLMPWQDVYLREFFGRRDPATGLRLYRQMFVIIPKKNGKSTIAAGLTLKLTCADGEPGAEVYGAAYDKDQAKIIFEIAAAMVEQQPTLSKRLKVNRHESRIAHPGSRSKYEAIANDVRGSHGFDVHGLVYDEYHTAKTNELYVTLDNGTAARDQPATFIITTAGKADPEAPCWKLYQMAKAVQAGIIEDPTFLPVIFEADAEDDPHDPATWEKANPGFGITVREDYFERKSERAKNLPSELADFEQLHLNLWPAALEKWLDMRAWMECAQRDRIPERDLRGRPCIIGVDLASVLDMAAVAAIFPFEDGTVAVRMRYFVPAPTIPKRKREDHVPYDLWARTGWLTATDSSSIDHDAIEEEIFRLAERYDVLEVAWDPWNAQDLARRVENAGLTVVSVPQTFRELSGPSKELERLLAERLLRPGPNPILSWNANNAVADRDNHGNVKPSKKRSSEKIDGLSAFVTGYNRVIKYEERRSILERRVQAGENPLREL